MTNMNTSAMAVITPSQNRHSPLLNTGYQGLWKVAQIATTDATIPDTPHTLSQPSGIRRASWYFSGNHRLTKKTSANSTTMEIAQMMLADASSAKYGTLTSNSVPRPKTIQMAITGIDASDVWR